MEVRTRFAPSPTGAMHIGGVRTALFAYLWAKKNNGEFSLRIEDTDKTRFVEGSDKDIIETLKWLGLDFQGEIVYQSKRQDIYKEHAKKLVSLEKAYEKDGAVWFRTKKDGKTSVVDLAGNRTIEFENSTQDDFVILKSDEFPTYHLAHVVDDHEFGTNPVIRGAEWISSIPKHVQLFESFGWEIPQYAHLPVILGHDKSKLSKRHGAKAASEFRKDGFLPEAVLNYMALLGWTPKDEILSLDEMTLAFDLKDVHIANPVFDINKLTWMNGEYIRKSQISNLKSQILEYLKDLSGGAIDHPTEEEVEKVAPLVQERIKTLADFIPLTDFLWESPEYERGVFQKLLSRHSVLPKAGYLLVSESILSKVLEELENMQKPWKAEIFEKTFRKLAETLSLSATQMFQLIRVAISGQIITPPLFECTQILGEEETLKRIKKAKEFLEA